jgi:hypothetical protein
MHGLFPGIHDYSLTASKTWMAGSSPAMTENELPAQRQLDRSMRIPKTRF